MPDEWNLNTLHIGRRVLVYDEVDSTNSVAAQLADDAANDGLVVLAARQTAGRGQHGRSWQCQPGDGVLLSVLLYPPPTLRKPAVLTAWAAVSVCKTVRRLTGQQARIKWPNDVLVRGRKVCGILIEQGRGAVAGVGLNIRQTPEQFAAAGLANAASLASFTDSDLDARTAAEMLTCRFRASAFSDSVIRTVSAAGPMARYSKPASAPRSHRRPTAGSCSPARFVTMGNS